MATINRPLRQITEHCTVHKYSKIVVDIDKLRWRDLERLWKAVDVGGLE
jgi:hypothetical protein